MFLHVAPDEKVIDGLFDLFEKKFHLGNKFIVGRKNHSVEKLQYVRNIDRVIITDWNSDALLTTAGDLNQFKAVFVYFLSPAVSKFVLSVPRKTPVYWFFFGAEVYSRPEFIDSLYGPRTQSLVASLYPSKLKWHLLRLLGRTRALLPVHRIHKAALRRVDFCCTQIEEDYQLAKKKLGLNADYYWFSFYSLDNVLPNNMHSFSTTGKNILIGNSSSASNNHLDVFSMIPDSLLNEERKLVLPLNYGDHLYGNAIAKEAKRKYIDNVLILRDFMPLSDYNVVLSSCNVAIMNHFRQQAFGNILVMVWLGAKIFMNKQNTIYWYLMRLGIHIYLVDGSFTREMSIPEEPQRIANNRKILMSEFNQERQLRQLDALKKVILLD